MPKRILFLCHGNICRSAAAEAIAKDILEKEGRADEFFIDSSAISNEEIGNPIYPPMREELNRRGIAIPDHRAKRTSEKEIASFDEVYYMDQSNRRLLSYAGLLKPNVFDICEFGNGFDEIEDPWYSGRYGLVVDQLLVCINAILHR